MPTRARHRQECIRGVLVSVVSDIWKHLYAQLCSQPVEGGGDRLHTELEASLTEDDASTDQRDPARDGGNDNCQDQRRGQLTLWAQAVRNCWDKGKRTVKGET